MKKQPLNTATLKSGTLLRYRMDGFGYGILTIYNNLEKFMIVKLESEIPPSIIDGTVLQMYLWSEKNGSFFWQSRILGKITFEKDIFIVISHCSEAEWSPERSCIRTMIPLPLKFFSFQPSDDAKLFKSTSPDFHNGTILEMTDREAVLETEEIIEGSILKGHMQIGTEDLDIAGKTTEQGNNRYKVQFMGLSDRDRKLILDFIYRNCRE